MKFFLVGRRDLQYIPYMYIYIYMYWCGGATRFFHGQTRRWNMYYSVSFRTFVEVLNPVPSTGWDIGCEQRTPGVEQQPFGIPLQERLKEAEAKALALQKRCLTVGRRNSCWSPTSMAVSKIARVHFKSFPLQHVGVELLCFWLRYIYCLYGFALNGLLRRSGWSKSFPLKLRNS